MAIDPNTGQDYAAGFDPFTGQTIDPGNAAILQQDFLATQNAATQKDPGLTVKSSDLVNNSSTGTTAPAAAGTSPFSSLLTNALGNMGSFEENLASIKGSFTPLSEQRKNEIRGGVRTQFAPQFAQQRKTNLLRGSLFGAQAAQRGGVGFGASQGFVEGTGEVAQAGTNALNELSRLQAAEENARIGAAQSQNTKEQQNFLQLANQLQSQQLQQLSTVSNMQNQQEQQRQQQAKYVLDSVSELGPEALAQFGVGSFGELETTLGLPSGFVQQLQTTKQNAANADSESAMSDVFNQGTQLALSTPDGQEFSLKTADGRTFTFVGGQKDIQIVTDRGGIFSVDKNSGGITTLREPRAVSTGSGTTDDPNKIGKLTPFFNREGQGGFMFQDPQTGLPIFSNQAVNQSVEPGNDIRFGTPFSTAGETFDSLLDSYFPE